MHRHICEIRSSYPKSVLIFDGGMGIKTALDSHGSAIVAEKSLEHWLIAPGL